jgi:hypothetical protein
MTQSPWWEQRPYRRFVAGKQFTTSEDAKKPGQPTADPPPAGPEPRAPRSAPPADPVPSNKVRGEHAHPGHAALDFGTTSTTVTLYDTGIRELQALSPNQRRRMAGELAALLDEEPAGPARLRQTWHEVRQELADRLRATAGAGPGATPAELLRAASRPDSAPDDLLDKVIAELERFRGNRGEALRRFLTPRLQHCYTASLDVLPLDTLRLFRVYLDGEVSNELPSIVYDTHREGEQRFSMLPPAEDPTGSGEGGAGPVAYRGLKQQLGRRTPRVASTEHGPSLEQLIGGALGDLVERTDTFLTKFRDDLAFGPGVVNTVVVTYPTMAPVTVRDSMRAMVRERGIANVDTRFDEAIAAAMFYVLREFGGTYEMSVEAFASRCWPVGQREGTTERPRAWRQEVLIVDVGGGTTDVALLRLELRDETDPTNPGADSPHYGRYFRLKPTVLGTTGESQRGGDYLTLQVFRWIKVLLADHLLVHEPTLVKSAVSRLDQRYLDANGAYLAGKLVTSALADLTALHVAAKAAGHVVPTAWRGGAAGTPGKAEEREQLFLRLWSLAEDTKKKLGTEDEVRVEERTIRELLRMVREMHSAEPKAPAGDPSVRLSRADFERLVGREVSEVMELPAALARAQLGGRLPDRVILTGRGALLPLVRRQLVAALAARDGDETLRQPEITTYPDEYAKHAASIGACWAASTDRRLQRNLHDRLASGVTWLTLDVDNLFRSLRGSFEAIGPPGSGPAGATPLFSAGEQLRPREPGGQPVARSTGWIQYDGFRVHRRKVPGRHVPVRGTSTLHWASFGVRDHLQAHPVEGFDLEPDRERKLFVQVEVTAGLDMTALVCHGRDPQITLPPARSAVDLSERLGETPGPPFSMVPVAVMVDPNQGGSTQDTMDEPIFPPCGPFDVTLVVDPDATEPTMARTSGPLPVPAPDGWRFYRRDIGSNGDKKDTWLATVEPPAGWETVACHAVLDEQGMLYVVAGELPYRPAKDLAEVFGTPGTVLRVPMTADEPDYNPVDDPFTGLQ